MERLELTTRANTQGWSLQKHQEYLFHRICEIKVNQNGPGYGDRPININSDMPLLRKPKLLKSFKVFRLESVISSDNLIESVHILFSVSLD